MDMFKEAESLACMLEKRKLKQRELAESLGVSPSYIANKLRLLNYSAEMRKIITDSGLSERHARALLRLNDKEKRLDVTISPFLSPTSSGVHCFVITRI